MLVLVLFAGGCATDDPTRTNQPDVKVNLDEEAKNLGIVHKAVDENTDKAKTEAERILMLAEEGKKAAPNLPQWEAIKLSAGKISDSMLKLGEAAKAVADIEVQLKLASGEVERMRSAMNGNIARVLELEGIIAKQTKELADYETGMKARQQKIWLAVTGFSVILLVLGIFLVLYGEMRKLGMTLVICSLTLTCVSYFMVQYVVIVAWIGGGLLFLVIAALLYSIVVNRKALFETVKTVDALKPAGWKEGKQEAIKAKVRGIQSPSTTKLIDKVRNSMGTADAGAKVTVTGGTP
jgi:hypothetical protein